MSPSARLSAARREAVHQLAGQHSPLEDIEDKARAGHNPARHSPVVEDPAGSIVALTLSSDSLSRMDDDAVVDGWADNVTDRTSTGCQGRTSAGLLGCAAGLLV